MKQFFAVSKGVGILGRLEESTSSPAAAITPFVQCVGQVFLVHQGTAAGIYQNGCRFHKGQAGGIDQLFGIGVRGSAGSPRHIRGTAHPAPFSGFLREVVTAAWKYRRIPAFRKRQRCAPSPVRCFPADDSQFLPVQFHQVGIPVAEVGIVRPTPVTVGIGIMAYTLGDVQYMRKDHLGNGSGAVGRYVGDNDARAFAAWMSTILYP